MFRKLKLELHANYVDGLNQEVEMGVLQGLVTAGGRLYAAWKGEPDDDRIFYSSWDGNGKWSTALTIDGTTSVGPALGLCNGSLYAAWKGEWSDPRLFFAKYNGSEWEPQLQIPNAYSDVGPALCEFGVIMIAAWKNVFDQNIYFATCDGRNWSAPSQIGGVATSVGPSLATFDDKLYAIWKGEGSDQRLWFAYYDGTKWFGQNQVPNVGTSVGASLAGVGSKLYAVWKGEGSDERLWYAYFDGMTWSGQTPMSSQTQIPGGSSVGAAIAEFNGTLYAMCKGTDSNVRLYNSEWTDSTWSGWANDIPGNTGPDTYTTLLPPPAGSNHNYLLADSKGAALAGTTVTIIVVQDIVPDSAESYSFQINCYSPDWYVKSQPPGTEPFEWQQFGFRIAANELFFWVNCFTKQGYPNGAALLEWDSRSMPNNTGVVSLSNNRLPAGWQLTTTLITDNSSNVTGFAFSIAQPDGTVLNPPTQPMQNAPPRAPIVPDNLAPILNFQAILVGENGGHTTDFSSGQGIFLCYETNNLTASVSKGESAEKSNVSYSSLPAAFPNGEFFQLFGIGSV
ncbi:MAG: hypothetical protein WBV67_15090 [Candidatus Cybelea sp.]